MRQDPFAKSEIRIAVIGGGTGTFTMLSALKKHTSQLAAIVSMADDGGSTGVLRDELGTLPPGDVRQCLIALSETPKVRDLFDYRFEEGTFEGHAFGNLLLTALEKMTGDFGEAVETASEILRVKGTVIPATLDNIRLRMSWGDKSTELHGERVIDAEFFELDPRKAELTLVPEASPNPTAITAIEQADIVVIAPGDLYTSLGPLLVIDGIGEALNRTKAVTIYVPNLVTKHGQTDGFTVSDHVAEIERFAGAPFLDYVLYNNQQPTPEVEARYHAEEAYIARADIDKLENAHYTAIGAHLLGEMQPQETHALALNRSLIRHDEQAVAKKILEIFDNEQS